MSYFRTSDADVPLRVVVVGAGGMGRRWIQLCLESDLVDLVGVVDIDARAARQAVAAAGGERVDTDADLVALLSRTDADAAINVTVPEAHFDITMACLERRIAVLCEKPLVPSLAEAYLLAGAAEHHSTLLMASQSRRYYRALSELRASTSVIGDPFLVSVQFFRDPHFGGFREQMPQPLLVDMAIHAFDAARFLTGDEPVSVRCETFNPPWSWYSGDAAAAATFEMSDGSRFVYTGSWCSGGLATSWNGEWRLSGPRGSATWDGMGRPEWEVVEGGPEPFHANGPGAAGDGGPEEIAGALSEFVSTLRSGSPPSGDVHANIWTLAMVHAAVSSAASGGRRVLLADLLAEAHGRALALGGDAAVQLGRWSTPVSGLRAS